MGTMRIRLPAKRAHSGVLSEKSNRIQKATVSDVEIVAKCARVMRKRRILSRLTFMAYVLRVLRPRLAVQDFGDGLQNQQHVEMERRSAHILLRQRDLVRQH